MKQALLQIQIPIVEPVSQLQNYGVLGIMAILLIGVAVYLERQRAKDNADLRTRVTLVENKLETKVKEHDDFVNKAYAEAIEINRKCVELLQEVKDFFRSRNNNN
jgi:hypothetical protein